MLPGEKQREIPSLKKLQHDISAEHIIEEVARAGQVQTEELLDRKTRLKELAKLPIQQRKASRNWCCLWRRLQHGQPEPGASESQIKIKSQTK
jgi:hypothetical protein